MGVEIKVNLSDFTNPEQWIGGFYELSIEFHPDGDDSRLNNALLVLQDCDFFKGLWLSRENFEALQVSLPINIEPDSVNQFYGILSLDYSDASPCLVSIIRINGESDWLDISIPQSYLEKKYDLEYPLSKGYNPTLRQVDELFIKLAETIYNKAPFDLAMIGEEVSGYTTQENITAHCLDKITCILPMELQHRLGVRAEGEILSNGLLVV